MQHNNITVRTSVRDDLTRLEIAPLQHIKPLAYRLSWIYLAIAATYNLLTSISITSALFSLSHVLIACCLLAATLIAYNNSNRVLAYSFYTSFIVLACLGFGGVA